MATQTADAWLMKLDAEGDSQWTRIYGGQYADNACAVQQTSDGGYIIAGTAGVSSLPLDAPWLIKTDANGNALWSRTYGWGSGNGVQQTFDGGDILVGDRYGNGPLLVKTDANGDTLWTRRFWGDSSGNAYVQPNTLTATADGGFAIAALTSSVGLGSNTRLIRLNGNGDTLWTRAYQGEQNRGYEVQQTLDGGFIIVGTANSAFTDSNDIWLVRTDANSDTLWTKTVGGQGNEEGYSVWQTLDSGYIVGGTTTSFGSAKAYFVKTQPDHGGGIEEEASGRQSPSPPHRDRSQASVYDTNGRMICRVSDLGVTTRLPVQLTGRLSSGVYFVHVEAGQATRRLKMVVTR